MQLHRRLQNLSATGRVCTNDTEEYAAMISGGFFCAERIGNGTFALLRVIVPGSPRGVASRQ